mmetsp:Transcript_52277/g.163915  ORF Transcript_52277/g.163915 Transcript_52277/m.163915 type:complete len:205 (+) Transcript_52277:497-1111(+)
MLEQDLVDEPHGLFDAQCHRVVLVVLPPVLDAYLDDFVLGVALAVLITLQDHRDHEVHDHKADDEDVGCPEGSREEVPAPDGLDAAVGVLYQALVIEDLEFLLGGGVVQAVGCAPGALLEEVLLAFEEVVHDGVPSLTRNSPEERDEGPARVRKVAMAAEVLGVLHRGEEADAQDAVQDQQEQQDHQHVPKLRQRQQQRCEDRL